MEFIIIIAGEIIMTIALIIATISTAMKNEQNHLIDEMINAGDIEESE